MPWTTSDNREITGRYRDFDQARRACLNDMGRLVKIHDPAGNLRALYQDGKELDGTPAPDGR